MGIFLCCNKLHTMFVIIATYDDSNDAPNRCLGDQLLRIVHVHRILRAY